MKTRWFVIFLLIFSWASPAHSRLTLGVSSSSKTFASEQIRGVIVSQLEKRLREPASIRDFPDEALLYQWVTRYRQIDLAILSDRFLAANPSSDVQAMVTFKPKGGAGGTSDLLVLRGGISPSRRQMIRDALADMVKNANQFPSLETIELNLLPSPKVAKKKKTPRRTLVPSGKKKSPDLPEGGERWKDFPLEALMPKPKVASGPKVFPASGQKKVSSLPEGGDRWKDFPKDALRPKSQKTTLFKFPFVSSAKKTSSLPEGGERWKEFSPEALKPKPKKAFVPKSFPVSSEKKQRVSLPQGGQRWKDFPLEALKPKPQKTSEPKRVSAPLAEHYFVELPEEKIVLGVEISNPLVQSKDQAVKLEKFLSARLKKKVSVRFLEDEKRTYSWLTTYRLLDSALLGTEFLKTKPEGVFHRLAIVNKEGKPSEELVVRLPQFKTLGKELQSVFLNMGADAEGRALLESLDGVSVTPLPVAAKREPSFQKRFPTPVVQKKEQDEISLPQVQAVEKRVLEPVSSTVTISPKEIASVTVPPVAPKPKPVVPVAVKPVAKKVKKRAVVTPSLPPEGIRAEIEGRWDDAIFVYRSLLVREPDRADLWLRLADIQSLMGRPEDTVLSVLWMLQVRPANPSLYYRLAQAQVANRQYDAALDACEKAVLLAPANLEYRRMMAQIALWAGNEQEARKSFLSILSLGWLNR